MIVKDLFCNNEAYTHDNWEYRDVVSRFSRLYYIIDGEAYYEEGQRRERLRKGYLYLTPVKTPFTLTENHRNKLLHTYVHIYTVPVVSSFTCVEVVGGTPLADAVALWRKYASTDDKSLLISIIQLVLSCVDRELGRVNAAAGQAKRYIDGYDSTDIDMDDITHAVGYTREHITRTFTAAYGMTPMQYVVSKKMNVALHSLESGDTVAEIAEALGYSSPYALSRAFKKYYGLPPGKYIKTLK